MTDLSFHSSLQPATPCEASRTSTRHSSTLLRARAIRSNVLVARCGETRGEGDGGEGDVSRWTLDPRPNLAKRETWYSSRAAVAASSHSPLRRISSDLILRWPLSTSLTSRTFLILFVRRVGRLRRRRRTTTCVLRDAQDDRWTLARDSFFRQPRATDIWCPLTSVVRTNNRHSKLLEDHRRDYARSLNIRSVLHFRPHLLALFSRYVLNSRERCKMYFMSSDYCTEYWKLSVWKSMLFISAPPH